MHNNQQTVANLEFEIKALEKTLANISTLATHDGFQAIINAVNVSRETIILKIEAGDISERDANYLAGQLCSLRFFENFKHEIEAEIAQRTSSLKIMTQATFN